MTTENITCPKCKSDLTYFDGMLNVCSNCTHEWNTSAPIEEASNETQVKDSNGNVLVDGDDIILIKDLKLNGSSTILKKGSKAKNIKLVDGDHEIDCKLDGIKIMLKACFVKKA
jgi:protein PhnA